MPAARSAQRGAAQSLWLSAMWTALGTALVAAMVAIVAVAIVWLPASGTSGSASSTIRAGLLSYLAALHAGITVDGVPAAFVPLGMTILTGVLAWRAGGMLADTAEELGERDTVRLLRAAALQAATFAVICAVLAAAATLGTSSVSAFGAFAAGFVLFAVTGGTAFVSRTALAQAVAAALPARAGAIARIIAVVGVVYLAAGAVLVAGAVAVHHDRVMALSREIGGGWAGLPVLLLGVLAAPNAVIAGAGYLSGAGFAVGTGTTVALSSSTHGTVPAFPILGALPDGTGATLPVWLLAILTPVLAGCAVAALARRADDWSSVWIDAGAGVLGVGALGALLAWQGGGAIGSGQLHAVGVSPWQFALALVLAVGVVASAVLGAGMGLEALRARAHADDARNASHADDARNASHADAARNASHADGGVLRETLHAVRSAVAADDAADSDAGNSDTDTIDTVKIDYADAEGKRDQPYDEPHREAGGDGKLAG